MIENRLLSSLQRVPWCFSPVCLKDCAICVLWSCDFYWNNRGWLWLKGILGEPLKVVTNKICSVTSYPGVSPQPQVFTKNQEHATFS